MNVLMIMNVEKATTAHKDTAFLLTFQVFVTVTRKQALRSLSLSYQKKDGHAWPCPSFFWYDTDFLEFESFDFIDHIL